MSCNVRRIAIIIMQYYYLIDSDRDLVISHTVPTPLVSLYVSKGIEIYRLIHLLFNYSLR